MARLPIWSYLIETTEGPILIDTGMPDACYLDPAGYMGTTEEEAQIWPQMTADDTIIAVLQRAGYAPEDLQMVINTHWHFDHAGGNRYFPKTPIVVQKAEWEAAQTSTDYTEECKDPTLNYRLVKGDVTIEEGVELIFTPGHSAGHQSILVRTPESGAILLVVDASYTRANFEEDVPFAGVNPDQARQSIARLKEIAEREQA